MEEGKEEEQWVLQFRDLPEVARQRGVTSRLVADVPVTSGDPMEFMKALNYSYVSLPPWHVRPSNGLLPQARLNLHYLRP